MKDTIREVVDYCLELNLCNAEVSYDEPMSHHTTFKVGGQADCYVKPQGEGFPAFSAALLKQAKEKGVPVFILGGGANIVVSDKGIRGIVLDTCAWKGVQASESKNSRPNAADLSDQLIFRSGTSMDAAAEYAAAAELTGLEFLAGLPGTIGGGVYMNARCYGSEIADVLAWTEIIKKEHGFSQIEQINTDSTMFGYKHSPFQKMDCLILNAAFNLKKGDKNLICHEMEKNRQDRQKKSHYLFPCAGSAFKNNRDFGKPSGQIIDEIGLKGFSVGGAQIAPFHGNIVINTGNATAKDIRALMNEVSERVRSATGFILEPEIIFVGE